MDLELIGIFRLLSFFAIFIGACMYLVDNKKIGRFCFSSLMLLLAFEGIALGEFLIYFMAILVLISLPLILSLIVFGVLRPFQRKVQSSFVDYVL
jgi:hypothetical protein